MAKGALIGLLSFLISSAAAAAVIDFKGMKFGTPVDELKSSLSLSCSKAKSPLLDEECLYADLSQSTWAEMPAVVIFGIVDGQLDSVESILSLKRYDASKTALELRFGSPTCTRRINSACFWFFENGTVSISWTDTSTHVIYQSKAGAAERKRRSDADQSKRSKDM